MRCLTFYRCEILCMRLLENHRPGVYKLPRLCSALLCVSARGAWPVDVLYDLRPRRARRTPPRVVRSRDGVPHGLWLLVQAGHRNEASLPTGATGG